jgi:hypothetical protein
MGLDIRLPIGLMFSTIGAILAVYGAVAGERSESQGHNVNLIWGAVILVFGLVMLAAWRFMPKADK